ncbi:uncharacterized protein LOC6536896 isoform X1 [Drosophila yakuba]|uniref:Uncharacterized protein, isoform D n=1 Tax=Drosophila yakuba TaxID=7245 RepID=A0A0R1E799_DROYA|nr:uncharacterized protein LOC6536896 isoform X1 [Drosophila yakuba]KRK03562.1 uncharacterized protein Dyak_GE26232, isoform D [Drosophila yakuba]
MADQVAHTKETDADEPLVNGELPMEEAPPSCCHVMSLSSMDVDADVDADAEGDVDAATSSSCVATASQLNPSPPPAGVQQAKPARSSSPPCHLLERLNFPEGNIINTLHTILALPPFDPYAPAPKAETVYKEVVSLMQWSQREDNAIELELSDKLLHECEHKGGDPNDETRSYLMAIENMRLFSEDPKNPLRDADGQLRAITLYFQNLAFIFVKHRKEEFFTFCSCKECLEYRETIMAIMMDQFKAAHMVVMLLDVLIKAYSPMLKNDAAYNKFEKLLECNKEIYWITSGYLYDKNAEYLDFIDDTAISDNMILVLFSAILMANNPMLLLQILAYNVECIVKAFSEGMIEIAQNIQENEKISAERMLTYILDGYSDLNCISQKISLSLFAFENDFLRKFKLSWVLLCQRLFQQHVFTPLGDTMLACILSLKEVAPSAQTTALIKRYMLFDEHMHSIERRWTDIWIELNKFNLSPTEHERRMGLLDVYNIFDKVVLDATSFSLPDISDDEFIDFQRIVDRQLAWKNIMAFTKLKWPDGFYDPPNKLVHEDLCKKCNSLLEHHNENCKCITCSIAGTPLRPRQAGHCAKCTTLGIVEKDPKLMKSKILSTCTSDEAKHNAAIAAATSSTTVQQQRRTSDLTEDESPTSSNSSGTVFRRQAESSDTLRTTYHIAWAVFQHLATRKRYRHETIEPQFICGENCRVSACQLARKILSNQLSPLLTKYLLRCFQPLSFTREELRSTIPSLMFFNRKLAPSPAELLELRNQHYVYKTYWTFVLSIYANFFVKFNSSCTDFGHLELLKGDLRLRLNSVVGDKEDNRFEQFLAQVIGYSPFKITDDFTLGDANIEKMQFGVDQLMTLHDSQIIKRTKPDSTTGLSGAKSKSGESNLSQSGGRNGDAGGNKKSKEKMRKCCADYADIGEPCKENHSKKRVKKECNHARFNETRDRLRKKLSQIVNDRKTKSTEEATPSKTKCSMPEPAAVPAAAAIPPKRPPKAESLSPNQPPSLKVFATAQLQSPGNPRKIPAAAAVAAAALNEIGDKEEQEGDNSLLRLDSLCKRLQMHTDATDASTAATAAEAAAAVAAFKRGGGFPADYSKEDMMQDFAEFLGTYTYTREQDQQRWINETLNFIEGKSQQPQTANPKKAAKKAKQKMRKEEEKRIKELEDLRGQFLDIYFKEFIDKYEMKALTAAGGRKKEKKRIGELETNIKNLQRAKAKVETVILELIATVKQTNNEFKFSYLPTKQQQLAKMAQLEEILNGGSASTTATAEPVRQAPPQQSAPQYPEFSSSASFYSPPGLGQQNTPVCFAPPQQSQHPPQLSRDVIAAMAANSITADPSKRIVTIRRVQLPHPGAEQQVTVVAKGSAPHEDKLLYTFVNGHMVASGPIQPEEIAPPQVIVPAPAPSVPEKSAKAKKKEAKRAAAAAAAAAAEAAAAAAEAAAEQEAKLKSKKQAKKTAVAVAAASSSAASSNSSKSQTPQSTRESSVCSVKPKTAPKKPTSKPPKVVEVTPPPVPEPEPEPPKRQKRLKSRLDPGQLDNNPFKSLHMQDSSEGEWETGSESEEEVPAPAPAPPPIRQQPKLPAAPAPKPVAPSVVTKAKPTPAPVAAPAKKVKQQEAPQKQPASQPAKAQAQPKSKATSASGGKSNPPQQHQQYQQEKVPPTKTQPQRPAESSRKQKQAPGNLESNRSAQNQRSEHSQTQQPSRGGRGNGRTKSSAGGQQQPAQQHSNPHAAESSAPPKRSQRGKRGHRQKQEDLSGIPHNMGYFNPNEVAIPPPQTGSYASTLAQQMQHLRISQAGGSSSSKQASQSPNCSIMDQLNRGVQVEHLSLPPGITLTKVDPAKSEQLRQKSESIRLLSKPLAEQQQQQQQHHFQQPSHLLAGYYGAAGAAGMDPNGVIMVEANPRPNRSQAPAPPPNVAAAASAASANGKSSRRRRRNRGKSGGGGSGGNPGSSGPANKQRTGGGGGSGAGAGDGQILGPSPATAATIEANASGNIITLRNPMFHQGNGPAGGGGMMPPNPNPMPPVRNFAAGLPAAPAMAMDQPAAIIKNENGMFTIRNPALHQAVTNGLAMGGYRQFGSNVNYYTPQEAVAEAARATQQKQQQQQASAATVGHGGSSTSNFSYFSSGSASGNSSGSSNGGNGTHNNISISCTNVPPSSAESGANSPGRLVGEAAVIARPKQSQKCLSAIGSELKQKAKDSKWPGFGQQQDYSGTGGSGGGVPLQEKYQQSSYYNGFEVFSAAAAAASQGSGSGGGSSDCHMHHSCGDDSPPPTITGFNSYLEGIPNTGVIRYDDAAFLKNLIPGQHLNNEVSIHNISESNFTRNNASPSPHHVEITSVFGNRARSSNAYDPQQQPPPGSVGPGANYCDNVTADYGSVADSHLFVQNNLLTRMPQPTVPPDPFGYDFDHSVVPGGGSKAASVASDLNEFLRRSPLSQRTSPYSQDENAAALETFVQNMNALQIATDAECSRLNGTVAGGGPNDVASADATAGGAANAAAAWW